jgi:hypothetical protein
LFDHHVARGGGTLSGFLGFVGREKVVFESELPWRRGYRRGLPQGGTVLEEGACSIGFFRLGFRVVDLKTEGRASISPEGALILDRREYRPKPFPLDAAEWRRHLSGAPLEP